MATHYLKTWPEFFKEIKSGDKPFEVRKNDRDFKKGDTLYLMEYDPIKESYTGRTLCFEAGYILYGPAFGIEKDYCVISLIYKV